jgi:transcriptional regulator with XRE-family HTH domain
MSYSVQELCKQKGVSLLSLVERSGMDLNRLQAIYLGRWTPNPTQRENIAQVLNTPSGDIAWQHRTPVEHFYGPC